jgi:hypothetical protein
MSESGDAPSHEPLPAAEVGHERAPRPPRAPWRTMALNLALIMTIFLTRERWGAWVVESSEPCDGIPAEIRALSPDARRAVIPWDDCWVLWDVEGSKRLAAFRTGPSYSTMFSPDGSKMLATVQPEGDKEETVVVDAETGARLAALAGIEGVFEASFSSDGLSIVAEGAEGYARIWNAEDGSVAAKLGEYPDGLWDAEFFPDGGTVLTAGPGDVRLWDTRTGKLRVRLVDDAAEFTHARVCAEGRNVFTCSGHRAFLAEAASGMHLAEFDACLSLAVSDTGRELAVYDESAGTVAALDPKSGDVLFERELGEVADLHFADGGRRLLAGGKEGWQDVMMVLDARTGDVVGKFAYNDRMRLHMSPDGARVLTKERWNPARLHSARTGALLAEWPRADPVGFLGDDRVMLKVNSMTEEDITEEVCVLRRIRPEQWWGVFCLWHLWLIVALALALIASGWRDIKRMRRGGCA